MPSNPYLSIVVSARNDNHGGDMLKRMQIFASSILAQADRFRLPIELIVVEWNPPEDKPPLAEALTWPVRSDFCKVRFIRVSPELHKRYKHAAQLPLYQMIAKNVGIRRARGEFVIATNIDILFSDELFAFMAERNLDRGKMYRCQRHDVNEDIPLEATHEEHLAYCRNNLERINTRYGSENLLTGEYACVFDSDDPVQNGFAALHTNACGDFTMLSKEAWGGLHGYPEFDMYSFHLDSLLCLMAHYAGYTEIDLAPPLVTYHIEHGGGFKPKDDTLDRSLASRRVMRMSDAELALYARVMHSRRAPIIFCDDRWGMADEALSETSPFEQSPAPVAPPSPAAAPTGTAPGSAISIFTVPEPFTGDALIRQRNALKSWRLLMPAAAIILIGDVEGAADAANEFGAIHAPVETGPYGHVRFSEVLEAVKISGSARIHVYLDPDLLMTSDVPDALSRLSATAGPFLAAARSHTVAPWAELSFSSRELCRIMRDEASDKGLIANAADPGIIAFNWDFTEYIPPITTASADWKRWFMGQAVSLGVPLIDLTGTVVAPRQWHPEKQPEREATFNSLIADRCSVSISDASLVLTESGTCNRRTVTLPPEPGYESVCRFFFHSIEDERLYGNIQHGMKLADWFEKIGGHPPEILYQLHVQRGKLLLVGTQYKLAATEFGNAILIDPDDDMPAPDLYRRTLFAIKSALLFDWDNYKLSLSQLRCRKGAETEVAERVEAAARMFSRNRFLSAASQLELVLNLLESVSGGVHFALSACLARGGKIREAHRHATLELSSAAPHPDTPILLQCLKESMVMPNAGIGTAPLVGGA